MKPNIYYTMFFILSVLFSCTEEKVIPIQGDMVGFVRLLNEEGNEVFDRSGVKVSLDEEHVAVTDSIGKFEFHDVPAGTYNMVYEKENYGTFKKFAFGFAGGARPAVVTTTYLIELPAVEVLSLNVATDNFSIAVSGKITETSGYNFVYYFSDSSSVSNSNYDYSFGYNVCCIPMNSFSHNIYVDNSIFHLGETIYMAIYALNPVNEYGNYNYYDYEVNKSINPAAKRLTNSIKIDLN